MRSPGMFAVMGVLTLAVAGLLWLIVRDAGSEPYGVDRASLSGWTIELGSSGDPWIVAARPPERLSSALLAQLNGKREHAITAPARMLMPLVLRGEYDEGLQGVYSVDTIARFARDAGIETAAFEPVCIGHKRDAQGAAGELLFVLLESSAFGQFRQDVIPAFPEHAGTGFYDSGALRPILVVDGGNGDLARWWPITVDEANDCEARVVVK